MNCQEIIQLWSSYHDNELDAPFRQEIQSHLKTCASCQCFYLAQQEHDMALAQCLNQGSPTVSLWQQEEAFIKATFQPAPSNKTTPWQQWTALLWPNPKFYAGLAAVWVALFIVNGISDNFRSSEQSAPLSPQQQAALAEQRQFKAMLMANDPESSKASRTQPVPPRTQGPTTILLTQNDTCHNSVLLS